MSVCEFASEASVATCEPSPTVIAKPSLSLSTFSAARVSFAPNAVSVQPFSPLIVAVLTLTAPKELFVILQLSAVVTVPSVPTAMGSAVGTVTERAVAAGLPPSVPSSVEER